jgi:hypothetical protein
MGPPAVADRVRGVDQDGVEPSPLELGSHRESCRAGPDHDHFRHGKGA